MITVEMSDDIRKYENKTLGAFTSRQIKVGIIGLLYSLPITALIPGGLEAKITAFIILMAPAILCAFAKLDGSYLEVIAVRWLYMYVLTPRKRKVIRKNELTEELKALAKKEEQIKLSKMTSAQRKKYMDTHGTKNGVKKVKYSAKKEFKVYT